MASFEITDRFSLRRRGRRLRVDRRGMDYRRFNDRQFPRRKRERSSETTDPLNFPDRY